MEYAKTVKLSTFVDRFVEDESIIIKCMLLLHPHNTIVRGGRPLVPATKTNVTRLAPALLPLLRANSAQFTHKTRHMIRLSDMTSCPTCGIEKTLNKSGNHTDWFRARQYSAQFNRHQLSWFMVPDLRAVRCSSDPLYD